MAERSHRADHSTICHLVQHHAPEIEKQMRWQWRRPISDSRRIDETYIKLRGKSACATIKGFDVMRALRTL